MIGPSNKFFLFSVMVFLPIIAFCSQIDSLYQELRKANDTQRVHLYNDIAMLTKNDDEGLKLANKALALSKNLNYRVGVANSLLTINKFNLINKQYSEVIKNAFRALNMKEELGLEDVSYGWIYHQLANSLKLIEAYTDAIYFKKKQLNWKLSVSPRVRMNHYILYSQLAELYYKTQAYDSALVYYKKGLKVTLKISALRFIGSSYNNIALSYQQLNLLDSAMFYFKKARYIYAEKAPKNNENYTMLGIVEGNIATLLPNSNPLKNEYLLSDIRYNYIYEKGINLIGAYLEYANFKIETNQYSIAKSYLDSANHMLISKELANPSTLLKLFRLYVKCYTYTLQTEQVNKYFTMYNNLYDSLYGKKALQELINSHSTYELLKIKNELTIEKIQNEKKAAEILVLENEKTISRLKNIMLLIGSMLMVVIAILIIVKNRTKIKRIERETALEKKFMEQKLDYGSKLLTQSSLSINRKKDFAEKLITMISKLEIVNPSEKQAIKLYIANELDIDKSITQMENFISDLGTDFFVRLKQFHPNLTDNDLNLIVLIRMQLSIKQIAIIKNITPGSVRIAKNRLRKKLKLQSGVLLYDYLSGL